MTFDNGERFHSIASQVMDSLSKGESGGSVNLRGETPPTAGYMVGGKSWSLVAREELFDSYTVMDYLTAHETLLSWNTGGVYVGWWKHNGRVHLDIADHIDEYTHAHNLGYLRKEIAIWDIAAQEELKVND